jgi:hypothetical protein
MRLLFLLSILFSASGLACAGAASGWQSFGFDGSGFVKGSVSAAIMVRDGYLPVPAGALPPVEDKLPDRTGAVALLCFQQHAGGKLQSQVGFAPMAGVAVTLGGRSLTLAARTDASGYLILALPPGKYELRLFGFMKKVVVDSGKTALVAMRGGKRMVD